MFKTRAIFGTLAAFAALGAANPSRGAPASETYRLVQSLGDAEHVSAKGLSKAECDTRKRELKTVATALGTYNEATGSGSITCLPESYFDDGK